MNKIVYCFLLFICGFELSAYSDNKELIIELDKLINKRIEFENQKKDRINFLKQMAEAEDSFYKKYDLLSRIVEEYEGFQSDSAFVYIEKGHQLALLNRNQEQWLENRFQYVFVCAQVGLLNESQSMLELLQPFYSGMNNEQKATYYVLYERLYMNLREHSENSHLESVYAGIEQAYNDSILVYIDPKAPLYDYHLFKKLYMENHFEEAARSIEKYLQHIDTLSNEGARGYYQLSLLYHKKGDYPNQEKALIKSVIADEHSAVRQNRSLRLLAQLLYKQGDIKKAYRYLQISLGDANFYGTKLRNSQIAEALPIIEKEYQMKRDQLEKGLLIGLILISVLLIILFVSVLYIRKKRHELATARKELMKHNEDLNKINEDLKMKTEELYYLTANLQESDQIKEKYVGYFLQLCSVYIHRINEYRKMVNRKIKTGQIEDLYKITSSTMHLQNEERDFYHKFDEAFLHIFPNFVDDFNQLLKDKERFEIKKGELLNTELRIFALIRLGIKDSSQIAECLGYNPVTIYSYRTKVKGKAVNKDSFNKNIMAIKRKV